MNAISVRRQPVGNKQQVSRRTSPLTSLRHLHQVQLADRWRISPRTLERWRWLGQGPQFLKIGGRVVYRLEDVEAYEAEQRRTSTAAAQAGAAG